MEIDTPIANEEVAESKDEETDSVSVVVVKAAPKKCNGTTT